MMQATTQERDMDTRKTYKVTVTINVPYLLDEVSMLRMDIAEIIRKADDTADWWKQEAEKWREHRD